MKIIENTKSQRKLFLRLSKTRDMIHTIEDKNT